MRLELDVAIGLGLLLILAAMLIALRQSEPRYNGKTVWELNTTVYFLQYASGFRSPSTSKETNSQVP